MKAGSIVIAAVVVAALGGAAYLVRGLQPSDRAIAEGTAFSAANNKMMSAMMGSAVVYSGNPDADFVMLMIPHHRGALDMAAVEAKYGTDPVIRALSQKIEGGQQPQIDQMTAWQKAHAGAAASADAAVIRTAFSAANDKMMTGMMGDSMAHSGNADLDFVKMMIPHHQGAIDMASVELKYGSDPDMKALAQAIIAAQTSEIAEMNDWLKAAKR